MFIKSLLINLDKNKRILILIDSQTSKSKKVIITN